MTKKYKTNILYHYNYNYNYDICYIIKNCVSTLATDYIFSIYNNLIIYLLLFP